jgi:hypothetical protein
MIILYALCAMVLAIPKMFMGNDKDIRRRYLDERIRDAPDAGQRAVWEEVRRRYKARGDI